MNPTHVHLLLNHLAIVGTVLGGLVLLYGTLVKSSHTQIAGYGVLIISSIAAVVTYLTGESAEEAVEHLTGVSESIIEQHEEFSVFALISLVTLSAASVVALYALAKNSSWAHSMARITILICVVSFVLIAWTGYLGGLIRHTELNPTVSTQQPETKNE